MTALTKTRTPNPFERRDSRQVEAAIRRLNRHCPVMKERKNDAVDAKAWEQFCDEGGARK